MTHASRNLKTQATCISTAILILIVPAFLPLHTTNIDAKSTPRMGQMKFPPISRVVRILATCALVQHCITVATAFGHHDHGAVYDGITVLRLPTGQNTNALDGLIGDMGLKTWTHASRPHSHVDVEVPKEAYEGFMSSVRGILKADGVVHDVVVMHTDLGDSIRKEVEGVVSVNAKELNGQAEKLATQTWFNAYHSYNDHLVWLDDLVAAFPNNSRIVSSGTSVEGRDIKGLNIFGTSGSGAKPAVIWHGTVHAREWITTMTVEYLAYSLLSNYANSTEVKAYVDKYDFYIFPIVNPDGFVYTQTDRRLWRKNRQAPPINGSSECIGRDLNRNWNISWSEPPDAASPDPCDGDYRGEAPSDTPEITALAAFLDARSASQAGAAMFVDWHAYGQLFMYPYGYDCEKKAIDDDELDRLVSGFATALYGVHQANYTTGPICTTIYQTSGDSTDYAYDVSKIKYSFAAELRDFGENGFILPPDQIRISGEETWVGVKYLLANMITKSDSNNGTGNGTSSSTTPSLALSIHSMVGGFRLTDFGYLFAIVLSVVTLCS